MAVLSTSIASLWFTHFGAIALAGHSSGAARWVSHAIVVLVLREQEPNAKATRFSRTFEVLAPPEQRTAKPAALAGFLIGFL